MAEGASTVPVATGEDGSQAAHRTTTRRRRRSTLNRKRVPKVAIIESEHQRPSSPGVYTGSYSRSAYSRANSIRNTTLGPLAESSRTSVSHLQLDHLLSDIEETETFSLHELRDGFFDAPFARPRVPEHREPYAEQTALHLTLSETLKEALWNIAYDQWDGFLNVYEEVCFTRTGVRLVKAFLGIFLAYVICLIPAAREWLGDFFYILPVSCIINHPARSVGSQVDGAFLTCLGTVTGLLWGGLAIYTSTSTVAAAAGYGASIVPFLMLFTSILGWLRCVFNRFFQAIICAGIALFYMCLADYLPSSQGLDISIWRRFSEFAIPFVLGQALCLCLNILVLPSAGNRPLALSFHAALEDIRSTLVLPRPASLARNRQLAYHFVQVSQTVRDFSIDLTFSRFTPNDARTLRNLIQGVLRAMIAVQPDTNLFQLCSSKDTPLSDLDALEAVATIMAPPTRTLIDRMDESIRIADDVIMNISGLPGHEDTASATVSSIQTMLDLLQVACDDFDLAEKSLSDRDTGVSFSSGHSDTVELFHFVHPIRLASDRIMLFLQHTLAMLESRPCWRLHLPSYPWSKAFYRMNPTVRHDRGGLTAGFYFQSRRRLNKMMDDLQSREWKPLHKTRSARDKPTLKRSRTFSTLDGTSEDEEKKGRHSTLRYTIWSMVHRLQNFESRFAIKITILCTLLAIPGLLPQSAQWWYENDCWWVIVTVWIMMHPRVGGNIADLFIRTSCAALGAIWAGASYAAGSGNPYVMAVFAALFMVPMTYRYTQSSHPRSGIIGCLSFTVVSLLLISPQRTGSVANAAWARGLSFVVGCVVAIIVNWVLWPFVARHELRKSISTMILNCAIIYRSVIARYIYYSEGQEPGDDDIERSEVLESTLREGFVRIRQLMDLTRHEIRLRAPFDPLPYGALIDACEQFFDRLVDVRQSSLFFRPEQPSPADNIKHNLLALRRDAVAAILMTLYVLAGALRSHRPLPGYLPSAAQTRRRLLDAMEMVEAERAERVDKMEVVSEVGAAAAAEGLQPGKARFRGTQNWEDVYKYAYSAALTDIVGQVQELEARSRDIVGVVGARNNPGH